MCCFFLSVGGFSRFMGVLRKHGRNLPGGLMDLHGVKDVLNEVHLYILSLACSAAFQG